MSSFKKQSIKLKELLKEKGADLPLVSIQEALARSYGFNNRHVALSKEKEINDLFTQLHKSELTEISTNTQDLTTDIGVQEFVNELLSQAVKINANEIFIIPKEKEVVYYLLNNNKPTVLPAQSLETHYKIAAHLKKRANVAASKKGESGEIKLTRGSQDNDSGETSEEIIFYVTINSTARGESFVLYRILEEDLVQRRKADQEEKKSLTDSVKSLLNTLGPLAHLLPSPLRDKSEEDEVAVQQALQRKTESSAEILSPKELKQRLADPNDQKTKKFCEKMKQMHLKLGAAGTIRLNLADNVMCHALYSGDVVDSKFITHLEDKLAVKILSWKVL